MSINLQPQLISLKADELLEQFGNEKGVPGAGSAAALAGMLACQLCLSLIKLTRKQLDRPELRERYSPVMPRLEEMEAHLSGILEPELREAFQKDSEIFGKVLEVREERDKAAGERYKQLVEEAQSQLLPATEILLRICEQCHQVCEQALYLFDKAYQSARGDSGAAASLALGGAYSALAVAYLNLRYLRASERAGDLRRACDALLQRCVELQAELSSRIDRLREPARATARLELVGATPQAARAGGDSDLPARERVRPPAENLSLFPQDGAGEEAEPEAELMAARLPPPTPAEEPARAPQPPAAQPPAAQPSDREVFAAEFGKYARGKNKGAWFARLHDFFERQGLGPFAGRLDFVRFLKRTLDEHRRPSPLVFDERNLLRWFGEFQDQKEVGSSRDDKR